MDISNIKVLSIQWEQSSKTGCIGDRVSPIDSYGTYIVTHIGVSYYAVFIDPISRQSSDLKQIGFNDLDAAKEACQKHKEDRVKEALGLMELVPAKEQNRATEENLQSAIETLELLDQTQDWCRSDMMEMLKRVVKTTLKTLGKAG